MHRLTVFACVLSFAAAGPAAAEQRKPNIVIILADDLGWADLGCYGNRFNETPNLDRLAAEGLRFTDFYAAGPVCSPTRAALLTGQYQARFGLTAHIPGHWRPFERLVEPPNATHLPADVVTLAERLRAEGYATAHLGKWHLGSGKGHGPRDRGFDVAFEFTGHTVPGPRQDPPAKTPKRTAEDLADRAIRFMEQHRDRPFFLHIGHFAVHIPLDTTPELQRKYEAKPKVAGYSCHPLYAGLLEELDTSVGRVLGALRRLRLDGNTLVIFTSDNGGLEREIGGWPGTLNRPLRDEKGTLYEGGIRVPTIVRWPGVTAPGSVCRTPAISVDFYPTLLDAAGATPPKDQPLDGVSLVPLFRQPTAALDRPALYWHYPHYHHSRPAGAVRAGAWKLIEFFDTGAVELYHLKDDLSEAKDLAAAQPAKAAELRALLKQWRRDVDAQMPQPNPAYDPKRAHEWWSRRTLTPTEAPGTLKQPAPAQTPR
jgi:uncharacterized sulfatase